MPLAALPLLSVRAAKIVLGVIVSIISFYLKTERAGTEPAHTIMLQSYYIFSE